MVLPFYSAAASVIRKDGDEHAAFGFGIELDATVDQGEQGVILADADVLAGMPLGAALARENIAGDGTSGRRTS